MKFLLYLALLQMGFIRLRCYHNLYEKIILYESDRWALTPPFHPYRTSKLNFNQDARRYSFCDTFQLEEFSFLKSWIHSRHLTLWSSDFPPLQYIEAIV